MTQTTTKDICDYLEKSDIPEAFKQIITQLEAEDQFKITNESGTELIISKQNLNSILQEYTIRQEDRQIIDFYQYSNLSIAFGKDSKLEELFLSEYIDLNEYKTKLAYQLHAFLFLEIGIDRILNGDFTQFGYGDEKVNQALQNAYFFVNDDYNLIDGTLEYDKHIYELLLKQYDLRGYIIENSNNQIELMDEYFNQTQLSKYDLTKTKNQVGKAINYVLENKKVPTKVKEYFDRDYNESIKQLGELKDIERIVKSMKKLRADFSWGVGGDKPDDYYVNMLVSQEFSNEILLKASVIKACFENTVTVKGKDYPKGGIDKFFEELGVLDKQTDKNVKEHFESIKEEIIHWGWDHSQEYMTKYCKENGINKENTEKYVKIAYEFGHRNEKLKNIRQDIMDGEGINVYEIIEGNVEDIFNLEKIDIDIEIENMFGEKLEELDMTDLVILLNDLMTLIPVAGDIKGGVDDLKRGFEGVEEDGTQLGTAGRTFMIIMGIAGILMIGGYLKKIGKAGRIDKYMETFEKICDQINHKLKTGVYNNQHIDKLKEILEKVPFLKKYIKIENKVNVEEKVTSTSSYFAILGEKLQGLKKKANEEITDQLSEQVLYDLQDLVEYMNMYEKEYGLNDLSVISNYKEIIRRIDNMSGKLTANKSKNISKVDKHLEIVNDELGKIIEKAKDIYREAYKVEFEKYKKDGLEKVRDYIVDSLAKNNGYMKMDGTTIYDKDSIITFKDNIMKKSKTEIKWYNQASKYLTEGGERLDKFNENFFMENKFKEFVEKGINSESIRKIHRWLNRGTEMFDDMLKKNNIKIPGMYRNEGYKDLLNITIKQRLGFRMGNFLPADVLKVKELLKLLYGKVERYKRILNELKNIEKKKGMIKKMISKESREYKEKIVKTGLYLYTQFIGLQPVFDGNKRTSRIFYKLFVGGYLGKENKYLDIIDRNPKDEQIVNILRKIHKKSYKEIKNMNKKIELLFEKKDKIEQMKNEKNTKGLEEKIKKYKEEEGKFLTALEQNTKCSRPF